MSFVASQPFRISVIVLSTIMSVFAFFQNATASTISGYVYAKAGRIPLPDIDVELLNNDYQTRGRTKTDGSGRYTFSGLPDGYYTVRVMAFRYDYEDQEAMLEIVTLKTTGQGVGNTYMTQDFYMSPRRGSLLETESAVVFAQDVPPEAKRLFDMAVADLSRSRIDDGVEGLRKSLNLFPKYYSALYRLGMEMFLQKKYGESVQLFMTAAAVNEKSATSLYYVGYSLHNLGKDYNKGAIVALENALTLAPSSLQILYLLGKIERSEGNLVNAEKHLLHAKKLAKVGIPEIFSELAQLYANDLKQYDNAADELEAYLKVSRLPSNEEKKTRKVISDLRAKAKQTAKTS